MKVEIGGGARARPGWVTVDLNPRFADVVADAGDLYQFADGTVTSLRAVDVLEHISYRRTDAALREWARVCAPGADVYIQVPDADRIMRWFTDRPYMLVQNLPRDLPRTPIAGATWRLCGGHDDGERVDTAAGDDWRWNAHYSLWSQRSLMDALSKAGFDVVDCPTNPFPNLCCEAVRR